MIRMLVLDDAWGENDARPHPAQNPGQRDGMGRPDFEVGVSVELDELDGLTVRCPDGSWFNLRPSNTEPLLRLNVEARDTATVEALRDEVLALVRGN